MSRRRRAVPWLLLAVLPLVAPPARAASTPDWVEAFRAAPTPAWAGGADVLVLEDSQEITVTASGRTLTRTRRAVRVLAPTGSGSARVSASYLRGSGEVKAIDAWETDSRGVFRHLGSKEAVDASATGGWSLYSDERTVSLGATDPLPGTVFASETVVEDTPLFGEFQWYFDGGTPSLRSSFSLVLPPGLEPVARYGTGREPAFVHAGQRWTWELTDLTARAPEPLSPRRGDAGSQVWVSLRAPAGSPGAGSARTPGVTFSAWPDVARWLDQLESPQCVVTPAIAARARALLQAERDTLARLGLLGRAVQRTNYVAIDLGLSRGWGYRPHTAEQVLAAGYGDCKDKANLLCALLRSVGHEAWMVSAYSGSRSRVVRDRTTPSQFNHCIVAMRVPEGTPLPAVFRHPRLGTVMAFDPTDPLTTFGELPEDEQGSLVLFDLPEGSELVALPLAPPETERFERAIHATLGLDGRLEAHLEERSRGSAAVDERGLRRREDEAAYRRALERWLASDRSSVQLEAYRTEEDSLAGTFRLSLDFRAPGFARTMGTAMMSFRPAVLSPRGAMTLPDSARRGPIQLHAECFVESVTVALPEGMRPEELPAAIDRAEDFGRVQARWSESGGVFTFVRSRVVSAADLPRERYADVRAFYALAHKAAATPIVLVKR